MFGKRIPNIIDIEVVPDGVKLERLGIPNLIPLTALHRHPKINMPLISLSIVAKPFACPVWVMKRFRLRDL